MLAPQLGHCVCIGLGWSLSCLAEENLKKLPSTLELESPAQLVRQVGPPSPLPIPQDLTFDATSSPHWSQSWWLGLERAGVSNKILSFFPCLGEQTGEAERQSGLPGFTWHFWWWQSAGLPSQPEELAGLRHSTPQIKPEGQVFFK